MIKRTFDITARIEQGQPPFCFQVVQNDKDVYALHIRITEGDKEIDYTQVSDATITFALANGAVVQSDPERLAISSGGITYEMGTSEISCPGKVLASIQLFGEDGERLTTARFQFEVVADLITPSVVQSESRFPILQQLVADVEQLKQDIVDLQIPDNSIMDEKLSNAAGQIKQRFASHMADYTSAHGGTYHKNLLHNWDFRNPVNQRGQSSYSAINYNIYSIDRWQVEIGVTLIVNDGYITLENASGTTNAIRQDLEQGHIFNGKTLTLSVCIKGVYRINLYRITSGGGVINLGGNAGTAVDWEVRTVTATVSGLEDLDKLRVYIRCEQSGGSVLVQSAKLELGSVSTLANDPPADYGEQLMLCKRFFRLWTTEAARTEALKEVGLMRISNPTLGTINIGGTTYYYASADL